jgi:phosphoadenosine phosphosulfate reductase
MNNQIIKPAPALSASLIFKIQTAFYWLHRFEPFDGYHLAFSGGKDSSVCLKLCQLSGVKFAAVYSITTVDPPYLLPYIRKYYPMVKLDHPKISMYNLISKKGYLPTRRNRFCCEILKEYAGIGKFIITGVRKEESLSRSRRTLLQLDNRKLTKGKAILNIIIDWTSNDVKEFCDFYKIILPDIYTDCSTARGGCIGCPLSRNARKDLKNYPRFQNMYIKAINNGIRNGHFKSFSSAEDVLNWWLSDLSVQDFHERKKQTSLKFFA